MLLSYLGGVIKAWSHLDIRRLLVGFWLHASNEHLLTDYYFPTSKKQGVRREAAEESENQSVLRLASSLNTPKELVLGYDYLTPFEKLHFILQIIFSFPFMLAAVLLEVCKHIPLLKHIFKYIIPAPQVVLVIVSRMIVSLSLWLIKKCSTILFEGRWLFLLIMPVVVSAPDWLPLLGITDLLPYLGLSGLSGEIIYYGVTIFIGLSIGLLCLYESEIRSALARHPDVPRVLKIYPVDTRIQQTQALANGRNTKHLAEARTESHEFERGKDKDVSIRESEYLNASGTAALVGKPTFKVRHIDGIRSPYYKMVGDDKDASDDLYYLPHNNGALVLERHKEVYTREKSEFRNGNLVLVPGDKGVPIQHPSWSDRSKATVRFDSEHGQYHLKFSDGSSDIWVDTARDVHVQLQEKGFKNVGSVAICPSVTLESGHYHVECPDSNDPVAEIFAFGDLRGAKQHLRRRGEDTRRLALLEPDIYSATFYARGTELKLSNRKLNAHHSRVSQFMPVPQKAPNVTNGQLGNSASSHTHRSDFTVADPDRKRNDSDSQGTTSTRKPVTADSASLLSIKINMALENVMQKDERWLRWLKEVSDEAQLLATGDMSRLEPILLKVLDEQMPNKVIEMEKRQGLRSTCENIRLKIKGHIEAKQFDTAILLLIKCPKKVARVLSSQLLPILDTCQNLATRVDTFFSQSHKENSALKTFLEQSRKVIEASIRYMSAPVKTETEAEQGVIHLDFDDAEQLRFDTPQQHFFNSLAYTQKYLITILKQVEELWKSVFDDHADAEKFGDIRQLIGEKQFDVALQEIEKNFAEIDKFIREQKSIILEAKAEIDALPFFLKKDLGQQAPSLVEAIEEMKSVELGLTLPSQSRVKKIKTGLLALLNDVESESKNTLEEFILKGSFAIAVQGIVRCYGENLRDQLSRKLQTKLEDGTFPHTGSGIEPGELEEAKASSKSVFNFDEAIKNIPNAIIQKNADLIWTLIKSRAYVSAQLLLDLSPLNNHFSQHSLKLVLRKLEAVDHIDDEKMYLIIHDIQQCHLVESLIPEILNAISNRVPLAQIENLKFERMMQVDHNSLPEALKKRYLATKAAWQNYVGLIQRSKNGTALSHASPILHLIEIDELLSSVAPDAKKDKPDVLLSPVNARGSVDDVWLWKLTQTLGTSYEWALMFLLDEERYGCIKLLMTLLKEHDHQNIALFMRLICTEDKTLEVAEIFARMGDMKAAVNALQCYSVDRVVSGGLIQPIKALSSSSDRDSKEDEDWALDDLPRDILKSIAVAERLIIGYQAFSQTGQDLASLEQSAEELRAYLNRKYEKTLKYIRWLLGPESKDSFSSGERATRILNSLVALDKIEKLMKVLPSPPHSLLDTASLNYPDLPSNTLLSHLKSGIENRQVLLEELFFAKRYGCVKLLREWYASGKEKEKIGKLQNLVDSKNLFALDALEAFARSENWDRVNAILQPNRHSLGIDIKKFLGSVSEKKNWFTPDALWTEHGRKSVIKAKELSSRYEKMSRPELEIVASVADLFNRLHEEYGEISKYIAQLLSFPNPTPKDGERILNGLVALKEMTPILKKLTKINFESVPSLILQNGDLAPCLKIGMEAYEDHIKILISAKRYGCIKLLKEWHASGQEEKKIAALQSLINDNNSCALDALELLVCSGNRNKVDTILYPLSVDIEIFLQSVNQKHKWLALNGQWAEWGLRNITEARRLSEKYKELRFSEKGLQQLVVELFNRLYEEYEEVLIYIKVRLSSPSPTPEDVDQILNAFMALDEITLVMNGLTKHNFESMPDLILKNGILSPCLKTGIEAYDNHIKVLVSHKRYGGCIKLLRQWADVINVRKATQEQIVESCRSAGVSIESIETPASVKQHGHMNLWKEWACLIQSQEDAKGKIAVLQSLIDSENFNALDALEAFARSGNTKAAENMLYCLNTTVVGAAAQAIDDGASAAAVVGDDEVVFGNGGLHHTIFSPPLLQIGTADAPSVGLSQVVSTK